MTAKPTAVAPLTGKKPLHLGKEYPWLAIVNAGCNAEAATWVGLAHGAQRNTGFLTAVWTHFRQCAGHLQPGGDMTNLM